jgi:hypothetical protein
MAHVVADQEKWEGATNVRTSALADKRLQHRKGTMSPVVREVTIVRCHATRDQRDVERQARPEGRRPVGAARGTQAGAIRGA